MVDRGGCHIKVSSLNGEGFGIGGDSARAACDDVEFETFMGMTGDSPVARFLHDSKPLDIN